MSLEILTNSSMGQFKNCRKAWYYRNVEQIVPRLQSKARGVGSAVHKGIETGSVNDALALYEDIFPNDQAQADKVEIEKATVQAMLEGYFERFGVGFPGAEQVFPELKLEVEIIHPKTRAKSKTFRLSGKVDGLIQQGGHWWLAEYKTAGQVGKSYIDKLALDTQVTTYIYAVQRQLGIKIDGVIYRIIRKPSIKQTKKETANQYIDRLTADYKSRPEFYFFEEKLYRSQADLKEFEQELWEITQDMLKCRRENLWYKNTSRCLDWGNCSYMPICTLQPDWELMFTTREPNEELIEEGVDVNAEAV